MCARVCEKMQCLSLDSTIRKESWKVTWFQLRYFAFLAAQMEQGAIEPLQGVHRVLHTGRLDSLTVQSLSLMLNCALSNTSAWLSPGLQVEAEPPTYSHLVQPASWLCLFPLLFPLSMYWQLLPLLHDGRTCHLQNSSLCPAPFAISLIYRLCTSTCQHCIIDQLTSTCTKQIIEAES